jgi:hypothetical protein
MFSSYLLIKGRNTFIITIKKWIKDDACITPVESCIKYSGEKIKNKFSRAYNS